MQEKIGVYPTEYCYEVKLPGVFCLLCLIVAVFIWQAQLEFDDV